MRSFVACLITFATLTICYPVPVVHALSVGAPVRTLEEGGFSLSGSIGYTKLDIGDLEVNSKSFFFKGAFPAGERLMPYLKIGFADIEEGSFQGSLDFSYGGGVLLDLISPDSEVGFRGCLDAQIIWIDSSEGSSSRDLFETQLSFIGSVRSGGTEAYGGISSSFVSLDGGGVNEDENGQGHLFFGVDYYMDYNFYFNAEAHLFGQNMLNVGVGYKF